MGLTVFDAGAVIGLLDDLDPFHTATRRRWAALNDEGERLILPLSAYAEALVRPASAGADAMDAADRSVAMFGFAIVAPDLDVARAAARLRAQHGSRMRLPDALVVATGLIRHADRVITTDGRWPVDVGVSVEVLRP